MTFCTANMKRRDNNGEHHRGDHHGGSGVLRGGEDSVKQLYPGVKEAEKQRAAFPPEKPDFIGGKPNYDKYKGVKPEQVLVWLNID